MPAKTRKSKVAKPKSVEPPVPEISKAPVSLGLAIKLRELDRALFAEFGYDMAYVVSGHGEVIAASDSKHGHMLADVKEEPPEGKVYSLSEIWNSPEHTKIVHPDYGIGEVMAARAVDDPELDPTLVNFEGDVSFVVPAPSFVASPPPWNKPVKMIRPSGLTVNTEYLPTV
ncbi:MAG: hypothetical protein K8U57_01930 [Planctomycetes bacterium]|nr:hypothetical protein [Planctomycetota bacterium]